MMLVPEAPARAKGMLELVPSRERRTPFSSQKGLANGCEPSLSWIERELRWPCSTSPRIAGKSVGRTEASHRARRLEQLRPFPRSAVPRADRTPARPKQTPRRLHQVRNCQNKDSQPAAGGPVAFDSILQFNSRSGLWPVAVRQVAAPAMQAGIQSRAPSRRVFRCRPACTRFGNPGTSLSCKSGFCRTLTIRCSGPGARCPRSSSRGQRLLFTVET